MEWWITFGIDPTLAYFLIVITICGGSTLVYRIKKGKWKSQVYDSEGNKI